MTSKNDPALSLTQATR